MKYVDPTADATKAWKDRINDLTNATLLPTTVSTYMGSGIPGKKFEGVCYAGGVGTYNDEIRKALTGWQGFNTVKAAA